MDALQLAHQQAEDDGLWFNAKTAAEAYLQAALRKLHAAVEAGPVAIQGEAASPPLPNEQHYVTVQFMGNHPDEQWPVYTADQMREYARAALLAAPVAIQGEAAIAAPGLVFMVAYRDSREVRGLFDTPAQAHAFTQRLKDAMKPGHDEMVSLQAAPPVKQGAQ